MATQKHSDWLQRFAIFTVLCTLLLIGMGGLVTSKGVGDAVPDWPTSFGYNMFLLPASQWIGQFGIFEEHSHRLIASVVGLLTAILTIWLWVRETTGQTRVMALTGITAILLTTGLVMGIRNPALFYLLGALAMTLAAFSAWKIFNQPSALRWWAMLAFGMVIVQGTLGGGRVAEKITELGIFHGTLAQIFLVVIATLALFNSRWWKQAPAADRESKRAPRVVRSHFFYASILIFLQLVLGATMRHQHAGLPVWDFPAAHGQIWPKTSDAHLAVYNQNRSDLQRQLHAHGHTLDSDGHPTIHLHRGKDITAKQVHLHMSHRVMAVLILLTVIGAAIVTHRRLGAGHPLSKLSLGWAGLILLQATLGALTVLKYKPADIATLHVLCGALALLTGVIGTVISRFKYLPTQNQEALPLTELKEATS